MDETQTYIKQCDYPEIQGERKFDPYTDDYNIPDLFYVEAEIREKHGIGSRPPKLEKYKGLAVNGTEFLHSEEYDCGYKDVKILKSVFIPRQDQIQEMMGYSNPVLAMEPFAIYRSSNQWNHFKTWEQLWLAFYMYEKHKKTWNGKEWVAEES